MRTSSGAGPRATITSSLDTSQQVADKVKVEDEVDGGARKTACPMLRRFRISIIEYRMIQP
jgi:hypothetical protein